MKIIFLESFFGVERPKIWFLDPQRFGVAFLAQTLTLKDGEIVYSPRHQPLKLPPGVKLIAVTRIEISKDHARTR
jgi:hypothetical protein